MLTYAGEPVVFFELVNGRTEQTNKDATFRAVPDPENQQRVNIFLAKALDYEKEWGGRPHTHTVTLILTFKLGTGTYRYMVFTYLFTYVFRGGYLSFKNIQRNPMLRILPDPGIFFQSGSGSKQKTAVFQRQ